MKIRQWLFLLLALSVAAVCLRLGFWQLDRLGERRARNEEIRVGLSQPPISLNEALDSSQLSAYQRVEAQGQFDPEQEILLSPRARNGLPGVHLVTPLLLSGQPEAILVDRGWIPADERNLPERAKFETSEIVSVTGYLRASVEQASLFFLPENGDEGAKLEWQTLDLAAIQGQIEQPLVDWVLVLTDPVESASPQPIPQPDLDLSEGPHLGYALQWFSFAAIALVGGGYWLWRQRSEI